MPISLAETQAITIYAFLSIISLGFLKVLFTGDTSDRKLQKIIGGLATFTIALISQNPGVLAISIFIGGLIIASEDFMKFLVAVVRSKPDEVHRTISALQPLVPSPTEIQEKRQEEHALLPQAPQRKQIDESYQSMTQKMKRVEGLVMGYFEDKYGPLFRREVKVENTNGSAIFDGALLHPDGNVREAIEVKFIREGLMPVHLYIRRFLERYAYLNFTIFIRIVIVLENATKEQADTVLAELKQRYGSRLEFRFSVFSLRNDSVDFLVDDQEKSRF